MDVADWAILITAIGGFLAGGGGLVVGFRGQNKTDNANQLASLLSAYDEIVTNLREEVARLKTDFGDSRVKLLECETQCRECKEALAELDGLIKDLENKLGTVAEN